MMDLPNEMLQDSAIVMTSKNPSLTRQMTYTKGPRPSSCLENVMDLLDKQQMQYDVSGNEAAPAQSGRTKSRNKTPRKKKTKSPGKQQQSQSDEVRQEAAATLLQLVAPATKDVGQENRSPAKKSSSRRERNRRQSKNNSPAAPTPKHASKGLVTTPKTIPKVNPPRPPLSSNNGNSTVLTLPPMLNTRQQVPSSLPFRRPWPVSTNLYQQNRMLSELNPFARSFFPRFSKPGISNEFVSREIFEYYQRNRQNNDQFKGKQTLRHALEHTLKQNFPQHVINLYMVGSSTNGIGDNPTSVDICIMACKRTLSASRTEVTRTVNAIPEAVASSTTDGDIDAHAAPTEAPAVAELSEKMEIDSEEVEGKEKENIKEPKPAQEEMAQEASEDKSANEKKTDDAAKDDSDVEMVLVPLGSDVGDDNATPALQIEKTEQTLATASNEAENVDQSKQDPVTESDNVPEITLDMIEAVLQNKNFAKNIVSIPAKVPIIKFKDDIAKLDITLNLNQDVSIRNTQLIRDYAKMDWRFPYLAMVLKQWARENGICSAIDKTISSYSWTLMVIHFLQVCDPPVLPSLQKIIPRRYDQHVSVEQTITNWRRYPSKWRSNNTSNLRQLLKALFRYYGYVFSFDQHVISVREGKVLDRVALQTRNPGSNQWNSFLCIEEPFIRNNTTRSVHDKEKFERIIELFRMSSNALRGVRISLFNVIADDIDFPINYRK